MKINKQNKRIKEEKDRDIEKEKIVAKKTKTKQIKAQKSNGIKKERKKGRKKQIAEKIKEQR